MSMAGAEARVVRVAKALGDPTRFALLRAVSAADELSCQDLTASFPLAQATVSHHLKVLADAGLVAARRGGPFHYYRAVPAAVRAHAAALAELLGAPARPRGSAPRRPRATAPRRSTGARPPTAARRTTTPPKEQQP